jgi:predicted permease
MSARTRLRSLLRNLLRGARVDRELDAELRGYVDLLVDEKIARGIPPEQARRLARMEIGGIEMVKEEVRSIRSGALVEQAIQDTRYALRGLRRAPVFTLAVVVTLALGIGANTAMFSAVDALLLRPLPVSDPDRLVAPYRGASGTQAAFSFPELDRLASHSHVFAGLAAWATHVTWMRTGVDLDRTTVHVVSPPFFQVLGVTPAAGRAFTGRDADTVGQAVVSDRLWRTRFAADPAVLGRTITLGTQPVTIIGVAPDSFIGLEAASPADAWITFSTLALLEPGWDFRDGREYWIRLVGRLQPAQTVSAANAALAGLAVAADAPGALAGAIRVVPAATPLFDPAARESAVNLAGLVAAIAGVVFVIACANVANLLIVRGAARRRDLGVRLAIGASRGRVVRQAVTETALLCLAGWLAGLVMAHWTIQAVVAFAPSSAIPPGILVSIDTRVMAFAALLTGITALLFSGVPALSAARAHLSDVMKVGPEGQARGGVGLRRGLVVLQVALSAVLLVGAGLFVRTLTETLAVQPGYDVDRVLLTTVDFTAAKMPPGSAQAVAAQVRERVAGLPEVEAVAWGQIVPFSGAFVQRPAIPEGQAYDVSRENEFLIPYGVVSDGYFRTLGMPLRGRDFSPADGASSPPVVIVNETLARQYWPGQDPIGKRLLLPAAGSEVRAHEVVGVVPDGKYVSLTEEQHPYMYLPLGQNHRARVALHVRTAGEGASLFGPIRNIVRSVNQDVAAYNPILLRDYVDRSIAQPRVVARLLALFGGIALLVAAVGVYGLTAYTVVRRTKELGVRIALGAGPRELVRMLVRQAAVLVACGLAIGIGGALLLARTVESLLYGVDPADPLTFAATGLLLGSTMMLATIVPAIRAARLDPVAALRMD